MYQRVEAMYRSTACFVLPVPGAQNHSRCAGGIKDTCGVSAEVSRTTLTVAGSILQHAFTELRDTGHHLYTAAQEATLEACFFPLL